MLSLLWLMILVSQSNISMIYMLHALQFSEYDRLCLDAWTQSRIHVCSKIAMEQRINFCHLLQNKSILLMMVRKRFFLKIILYAFNVFL